MLFVGDGYWKTESKLRPSITILRHFESWVPHRNRKRHVDTAKTRLTIRGTELPDHRRIFLALERYDIHPPR
jgi:hypothetical protein